MAMTQKQKSEFWKVMVQKVSNATSEVISFKWEDMEKFMDDVSSESMEDNLKILHVKGHVRLLKECKKQMEKLSDQFPIDYNVKRN